MFKSAAAVAVTGTFLAIALAGCTSGSDPAEPGGSGGSAGGGTAECLARSWVLDVADAAQQLGENLASKGLNVTQSEGAGRQTFTFSGGGDITATIDVTYTVTVVNDPITLTLVQTHSGAPSGTWSVDGDTVSFTDWDNAGYSVQNQTIVNGTVSPNQIDIPSEDLDDGATMTVQCDGDTLSTKVSASPFTQHWTAEG